MSDNRKPPSDQRCPTCDWPGYDALREENLVLLKALQALVEPYKTLTEEALRAGLRMEFGPPDPKKGTAIWNARVAIAGITGGEP